MQCVILAAGKGTRLQPFTNTRSKGMAPILDIPIVERILNTVFQNGISDFILVKSPSDLGIVEHFKNYKTDQLKITFVDQLEQLGMANALSQAIPFITEDFIMTVCDSLLLTEDIKNALDSFTSDTNCVLTLEKVSDEKIPKCGIVGFNSSGLIDKIVEKPTLEEAPSNINALPFYIFSKKIVPLVQKVMPSVRGEYEIQDAIQMLIAQYGPVKGVYMTKRYNLTSLEDLKQINLNFLTTSQINRPLTNCTIVDPVFIGKGEVIENCIIGPNVYIESGTIVEPNSNLKDTVVLKEMVI